MAWSIEHGAWCSLRPFALCALRYGVGPLRTLRLCGAIRLAALNAPSPPFALTPLRLALCLSRAL